VRVVAQEHLREGVYETKRVVSLLLQMTKVIKIKYFYAVLFIFSLFTLNNQRLLLSLHLEMSCDEEQLLLP